MNKTKDEYRSNKLTEFINEIQYKNRNPKDNSVLDLLRKIDTNPELYLEYGKYLYRSRIIHENEKDKINIKDSFLVLIKKVVLFIHQNSLEICVQITDTFLIFTMLHLLIFL